MSSLLHEVANKAYTLSSDERAKLAHDLIVSLDDIPEDSQTEIAWNVEIEKRVKEIKNGTAKGRPAEEILSEIRSKYS
ncbi:MAG: addiction module protein [Leptospirales bacterium]